MKAMILKEYDRDLEMGAARDPTPGPGEIVLRTRACGICYTDVKMATGQLRDYITLPRIPGHEIAGEVAAVGLGVDTLKVGDKGVVYFIVSCGHCEFCLAGLDNLCASITRIGMEKNGGYAEYVLVPARNLCTFESDAPFERMAVIPDAVATPYHALVNMANVRVGQRLLVVGAGGLGLNAVQIAEMMGLRVCVADMNPAALAIAKDLGAECLIDTRAGDPFEAGREFTGGLGFDAVLEGVGREETLAWTLRSLKKNGVCVIMGYDAVNPVPFRLIDIHNNQWHIVGTKVSTRNGLRESVALVESGKVVPHIHETIALEDVNQALAGLKKGGRIGRTVITSF